MRRSGICGCFLALLLISAPVALGQDPAAQVIEEPVAEVEAPEADATEPEAFDEPAPAEEMSPETGAEAPLDPSTEDDLTDGTTEADGLMADEPAASDADDDLVEDEDPASRADWSGLVARAPKFLALTHHAAVHLPIALWSFGALFVVIGAIAPSWRNQVPIACLLGGAITSVAAVASGWWYAEFEWGEPWAWGDGFGDWSELLVKHRWMGVTLAFASIFLSVIAMISQARRSRRLGAFWRLGLIALAAAVAWEGHLGGELIHGEGFLEDAYQAWVSPEAAE